MIEYTPSRRAQLTAIAEAGMMSRLSVREKAVGIVPPDQLRTTEDRLRQYARLEQMIGSTPLDSWQLPNGITIWIKREAENPTESHYDRASVAVLKRLEMDGFIKPGDRILEGTSGSAGRAFAWACNRLGYQLDMIVPHADEFPEERARDIKAFGANVIHADELGGIGRVMRKLKRRLVQLEKREGFTREDLALEGKPSIIFRKGNETIVAPNHAEIEITPRAFGAIAREVVAQLRSGVHIDTFISTLGNGSTLKGILEVLKAENPNLTVIGVEPRQAPTNAIRKIREELIAQGSFTEEDFGGREPNPEAIAKLQQRFMHLHGYAMPSREEQTYHKLFGASVEGYEPPFVETDKLSGIVLVDDEWEDFKRRVNTYAWLNGNPKNIIGNTTAANLYIALQLAKQPEWQGKNILVINYDKADQYPDWPPEIKIYEYPLKKPQPDEVPYSLHVLEAA